MAGNKSVLDAIRQIIRQIIFTAYPKSPLSLWERARVRADLPRIYYYNLLPLLWFYVLG